MTIEEPKRRGRPAKAQDGTVGLETEIEQTRLDTGVRVWASLGATINTGNYENQKIDIGITGIPVDADEKFIKEQLELAKSALHQVVETLAEEMIRRMSEDHGR